MRQVPKGNSIFDAIPNPVWWLAGAASGFIAGHVISGENAGFRVATHSGRITVVALALCLSLTFVFAKRKFPAFCNVALWSATFCVGLVRW